MLVPNPAHRPNVSQILKMVANWDQLVAIRLTESAQQIKNKNANANPSGGSKIKDLTYDDIAVMH